MALRLHPCNNHARVTAKIDQNAHSKEIVCKKTWCTKRQLPQKQQRKAMSETIKHPSGTPAKKKGDRAVEIHMGPQRPKEAVLR